MPFAVSSLPRGARLTEASWHARHRIVYVLLWSQVPAFVLLGVLGPRPMWEAVVLPLGVALIAAAVWLMPSITAKSTLTGVGLVVCTFVAIELSGGAMAAHIHLYAVLIFIALYQQWAPLVFSVLAVVVHHGIFGIVAPERVFGMHLSVAGAIGMVALHAGLAAL